jgi:hypothetical protein
MKKKMLGMIMTAGTLAAPLVAYAAPVTYDFTGSGTVCNYTGTGNATACTSGQTFTGSVTFDVLASGPNGSDAYTNGSTVAYDADSWVQSDFTINWGSNTFNPDLVPNNTLIQHTTEVMNDNSGLDEIVNDERYAGYKNGVSYLSAATLTRATNDTSWLASLAFDLQAGLSPGSNQITFTNYAYLLNLVTMTYDYTGFSGSIDLGSLTKHGSDGGGGPTTPVPEPGSFALAGIGVMVAGFSRWRRKVSAKAT